ncbi:MAG: flavodoxin [Campylobacteraceae bacterium]|jgi:flavodoxin I|nr:flavodoxin [Campylobacteraceae bacterium]
MSKTGIFYASAGGDTTKIAEALSEAFELLEEDAVLMESDFDDVSQFEKYDVLFLGSSTWGQGDVHFSWVDALFEISSEHISFEDKTVAFFGAGDSVKHKEHFCSALGKLYQVFKNAGAKVIGFTPATGYTYQHSLSQVGDKFCGLAIDNTNEADKTQQRIESWIQELKKELE